MAPYSRALTGISRPRFSCCVGVEECDLVAVAERIGDQGWRSYGEVLVQCRVSRTEQFYSEATEPEHDRVRVEVLACPGSGEEPRAFRACCCSEVGAVPEVLAEEFCEGLWDGDWMRAKGDRDRAGGVVDVD